MSLTEATVTVRDDAGQAWPQCWLRQHLHQPELVPWASLYKEHQGLLLRRCMIRDDALLDSRGEAEQVRLGREHKFSVPP